MQGNAGKRRLNLDEPKPALGATMPPWMLAEPALVAEWKRHAPRLTALGLLTVVDDDALATLCVLEVRLRAVALLGLKTTGRVIELSRELRSLWRLFGMTPADRVRVKGQKPKAAGKLSKFPD